MQADSRRLALRITLVAVAVVGAMAPAGAAHPLNAGSRPLASNLLRVVVPRGQPVQIVLANDPGFAAAGSVTNAVQMAVAKQPTVRGFPIRINIVNAPTCGNPPNAAALARATAYRITANLQNVGVLGQICSAGFAGALPVYQNADVVVVSGSATNGALPAAARTVFDRTVVGDNALDAWYALVSQLPSDLAWRQAYADEFGGPPGDYADLYYDAAGLLISDLQKVSRVNAAGQLVVGRAALARAVRTTAGYPGVSCSITLDPTTGNRRDEPDALGSCALAG